MSSLEKPYSSHAGFGIRAQDLPVVVLTPRLVRRLNHSATEDEGPEITL